MKTRFPGWYRQREEGWLCVWINSDRTLAVCRARRSTMDQRWQLRRPRDGKAWWPSVVMAGSLHQLVIEWVTVVLDGSIQPL